MDLSVKELSSINILVSFLAEYGNTSISILDGCNSQMRIYFLVGGHTVGNQWLVGLAWLLRALLGHGACATLGIKFNQNSMGTQGASLIFQVPTKYLLF